MKYPVIIRSMLPGDEVPSHVEFTGHLIDTPIPRVGEIIRLDSKGRDRKVLKIVHRIRENRVEIEIEP